MISESLVARVLEGTLTTEDFAQLDPSDRVKLLRELVEVRRKIEEALEALGFSSTGSGKLADFERRGRPRVPIRLQGSILVVGTLTHQPCRVADLSDTGAKLETHMNLKRNQVVVLTFNVGENKHQLWCSIRWVSRSTAGRRTVGVEFHHMSQETHDDLLNFLQTAARTG